MQRALVFEAAVTMVNSGATGTVSFVTTLSSVCHPCRMRFGAGLAVIQPTDSEIAEAEASFSYTPDGPLDVID